VTVTREQALAFVEALTGTHGSEGPVPNSIAARVHLEAVLGLNLVPDQFGFTPRYVEDPDSWASHLLDYLQCCVDALRPEGYGRCATCAEWGEKGNANRRRCHSGRWQSEDVWLEGSDDPHPWTQPTFPCGFWHPRGGGAS